MSIETQTSSLRFNPRELSWICRRQPCLSMKISRWKTSTLRHFPPSGPSTQLPAIVLIPDIVCQVCRRIPFCLRNTVSHPSKPVATVLEVIIFEPGLQDGFEIVKGGSWPHDRRQAPVRLDVVTVTAVFRPHHALGCVGDISRELSRCGCLEADGAEGGLGLVFIDEGTNIVGLCLDARNDRAVGYWGPRASEGKGVWTFRDADTHVS